MWEQGPQPPGRGLFHRYLPYRDSSCPGTVPPLPLGEGVRVSHRGILNSAPVGVHRVKPFVPEDFFNLPEGAEVLDPELWVLPVTFGVAPHTGVGGRRDPGDSETQGMIPKQRIFPGG